MSNWEFEKLVVNPDGSFLLQSYLGLDGDIRSAYSIITDIAAQSLVYAPTHIFYKVGTALAWHDHLEPYGKARTFQSFGAGTCGLYGEDSLIAQVRAYRKSLGVFRGGILIFAYVSTSSNLDLLVPSGNCRDLMRDVLPVDKTVIIQAHVDKGKARVVCLKDFLCDRYGMGWDLSAVTQDYSQFRQEVGLDFSQLAEEFRFMVEAGGTYENDVYSSENTNLSRKYCAAIIRSTEGPRGRFYGTRDVGCYGRSRHALYDAARIARRLNQPYFQHVIIASEDDGSGLSPDVMYEDRQDLLELNFQQECMTEKEHDPPVYLMTYRRNEGHLRLLRLWKTSVKRWLPFAFSPANFGPEFIAHATEMYKGKKGLVWQL